MNHSKNIFWISLCIGLVSCMNLVSAIVIDHDQQRTQPAHQKSKIQHVIVLMLENRAFDHMLGFLKEENDEINGCLPGLPGCSNPISPECISYESDTTSWTTVNNQAVYQQVSPHHSIHCTTGQIYPCGESNKNSSVPSMNGFIQSYADNFPDDYLQQQNAESIMQCFDPSHVPAIAQLAREFGLSDTWFASVPGPTMVNRAYAASSTSHGMGTNDEVTMAKGLPQKTMFRQLLEMGLDYRVYFQDVPTVLQFKDMRHKEARKKYRKFSTLFSDLQSGSIPAFSWIEPAYFEGPGQPASDQHPDHDVSVGDKLIKDIYEAVRSSPVWENTAFIVTYDEHGGFFDHVSPPTGVPNPDGINAVDDPFDFTRLGVRVPAIFVSPYVAKGTIFRSANLEHSSIIATVVHKLFVSQHDLLEPEYLTKRDAWAATFEDVFSENIPRVDCPELLVEVPSHRSLYPTTLPVLDGHLPLSDLQQDLMLLVAALSNDSDSKQWTRESLGAKEWTERKGLEFVTSVIDWYLIDSRDD